MSTAAGRRGLIPSTVRVGGKGKSALFQALREHLVELNQSGETLFEDRRFTTLERGEDVRFGRCHDFGCQ